MGDGHPRPIAGKTPRQAVTASAAVRLLNVTSTGERSMFHDPVDDFAQFDRFPPALRWRITENNTKASCAAVASAPRVGAAEWLRRVADYRQDQ